MKKYINWLLQLSKQHPNTPPTDSQMRVYQELADLGYDDTYNNPKPVHAEIPQSKPLLA